MQSSSIEIEVTEEQRAAWREEKAASDAALAARAEQERQATERAQREAEQRLTEAKAKRKELAQPAAEFRAARKAHLTAIIAEFDIVIETAEELEMEHMHRASAGAATRLGEMRLPFGSEDMRRLSSQYRSELAMLNRLEDFFTSYERERKRIENEPKRRYLSGQLQTPDDVAIIVGPHFGECLYSDADGTRVHPSGKLSWMPRSEWEAVKEKFAERRKDRVEKLCAQRDVQWGTQPSSEEHLEKLNENRKKTWADAERAYEQEQILVLEGDERWDLHAIYTRLEGQAPYGDAGQVSYVLAGVGRRLTNDLRTHVRWIKQLRAGDAVPKGPAGLITNTGDSLMHEITKDAPKIGGVSPMLNAAVAWWKTAESETTDDVAARGNGKGKSQ